MNEPATQIEWYSGYTRYDQPRRLFCGGRWLVVRAVLARGILPEGAFVQVLASDQRRYRLDYDGHFDVWQCQPCD